METVHLYIKYNCVHVFIALIYYLTKVSQCLSIYHVYMKSSSFYVITHVVTIQNNKCDSILFQFILGTTIIHENNEESRYVNEIIRNCQKTHVYIIWFINKQTRGFMIICKGLNTLHLYS